MKKIHFLNGMTMMKSIRKILSKNVYLNYEEIKKTYIKEYENYSKEKLKEKKFVIESKMNDSQSLIANGNAFIICVISLGFGFRLKTANIFTLILCVILVELIYLLFFLIFRRNWHRQNKLRIEVINELLSTKQKKLAIKCRYMKRNKIMLKKKID